MHKIKTLCVVDDDEIFQFLTRKVIEETGIVNQVKVFSNGLDAINYLKDGDGSKVLPDVIFLDLNMPVMDGWEFLEAYKQLQSGLEKPIPIYIISSSIAPTDVQKAKANSAVKDYIIKPFTKDKFVDTVNNLEIE